MKNHVNSGFTIIEFLIALFLASILFIALSTFITHLYLRMRAFDYQIRNLVEAHHALAVAMRDISQAPQQRALWKERLNDSIIYHAGENDYQYTLEKDALVRVEGMYDAEAGEWDRKVKSIILSPVDTVLFEVEVLGELVKGVRVTIGYGGQSCTCFCRCLDGARIRMYE